MFWKPVPTTPRDIELREEIGGDGHSLELLVGYAYRFFTFYLFLGQSVILPTYCILNWVFASSGLTP